MRIIVILLLLYPATSQALDKFPKLNQKGATSAKTCGKCHEAIFAGWQGSMHANAMKDPIFYPAFLEASRQTDGKSEALCRSCHAPIAALSQEGVTCDFCHRIKKAHPGTKRPFVLDGGLTKYGPLKGVSSPVHPTSYSRLFEEASLCGGCHEFTNANGAPVLETYSEWRESPQAKAGKTCQSCHMPKIEGLVVPPRIKPTREIYIHSHEAAGGHSAETIRKAVKFKIGKSYRRGDKIHSVVELKNVGSGHKVPTGIPTRKLVLNFQALSQGAKLYSTERIYQKRMIKKNGEVITKDADVFLNSYQVKDDNRLKPFEERDEHFTFLAPSGKPIEIVAQLYYIYTPNMVKDNEMRVKMGESRITVPVE